MERAGFGLGSHIAFLIGTSIVAAWAESWLAFLVGLVLWAMFVFKEHERKARAESRATHRTAYDKAVREITESSLPKMRLARSQLVSTSPMGIEDTKRFDTEMLNFLTSKLRARRALFDWMKHAYPGKQPEKAIACEYERWIRSAIFARMNESPPITRVNSSCTRERNDSPPKKREGQREHPRGFEERCARLLDQSGWLTTLTPQSGDYGVDIIARQGNFMVVLQCKRYSSRVGPAAVQEIAAGETHYGADAAAVVSKASYTTAAINLAKSNSVLLMHPRDLSELWNHCHGSIAVK